VILTDAAAPDALDRILAGERLGTLFAPQSARMGGRKRWLAAGLQSKGRVHLDQGACTALLEHGRSLLPVGITAVDGSFDAGEIVTLVGPGGSVIGSGLTNYSSAQVQAIQGKHSNELLPEYDFDEVVHRNNMVLWRD
jgi:glutamate 5-kinase